MESIITAISRIRLLRFAQVAKVITFGGHHRFVPEMGAHPVDRPAFEECSRYKFMPQIMQAGAERDIPAVLLKAR